ncbi:MAG: hypothetical protein IPF66_19485 [Holophagales bacterium]|nr:hypothetical protein [Holophagales bacterium]
MAGRTVFSRVSGGIVLDSFSIVSLFTGLLAALPAGLLLLIGSSGPRSAGIGAAVSVVWGLTVLVFVSRFAQLGIAGDSEEGSSPARRGPGPGRSWWRAGSSFSGRSGRSRSSSGLS